MDATTRSRMTLETGEAARLYVEGTCTYDNLVKYCKNFGQVWPTKADWENFKITTIDLMAKKYKVVLSGDELESLHTHMDKSLEIHAKDSSMYYMISTGWHAIGEVAKPFLQGKHIEV